MREFMQEIKSSIYDFPINFDFKAINITLSILRITNSIVWEDVCVKIDLLRSSRGKFIQNFVCVNVLWSWKAANTTAIYIPLILRM